MQIVLIISNSDIQFMLQISPIIVYHPKHLLSTRIYYNYNQKIGTFFPVFTSLKVKEAQILKEAQSL